MAIELTPVSLTKDSQEIRAFQFNNALIPPQSISQLIQVDFPGLKANEVGKFSLSSQINFDLLVKGFQVDIVHDDSDDVQSAQYHVGTTPLVFFLVKPDTGEIVRKITASITGYPAEPFFFVFHRDLNVHLKAAAGFHSITFFCEPIYLSNQITPTQL